jgi:hypothetical protein
MTSTLHYANQPSSPLIGGLIYFSVFMTRLNSKGSATKIYQKSDFKFIGFKVIDCLGKMHILKSNDCFEFDHQFIIDEEIDAPLPHMLAFEKDMNLVSGARSMGVTCGFLRL